MGGSSWILSTPSLALVTDDVIIVFRVVELRDRNRAKIAVAYLDGDEIVARHVGGTYVTSTGYLTTVVETFRRGAVLRLADGSLLSVPEYDQYDTGWWLPPYKALLTGNKLYLYNLRKDIGEQKNLATTKTELAYSMHEEMKGYFGAVKAPLPKPNANPDSKYVPYDPDSPEGSVEFKSKKKEKKK